MLVFTDDISFTFTIVTFSPLRLIYLKTINLENYQALVRGEKLP
ncbi:hypothetical protein RINTHH_13410 [Richelia intracellularis HH01]|uniref:Uncharacterized protein n=1 Tax=Richelia intracellularis HH01 TaxID=1165094 RepID=M1X5N0_9NOST|nr:hypothetical protein RINTHH_13410 [Richelia intracellularis HH01]